MNSIDPTRLIAIFRSLSAKESNKNISDNKRATSQTENQTVSVEMKGGARRDKETLKKNIHSRLSKLKVQDKHYQEKAPTVVIKEILLWEFGDNFLQHPEFQHISQTIINDVRNHSELDKFLRNFIKTI